jgi:hypothetical protein
VAVKNIAQYLFPVGTSVKLFAPNLVDAERRGNSGPKSTAQAGIVTVAADGTLSFDLPVGHYVAAGQVGSEYRYLRVSN